MKQEEIKLIIDLVKSYKNQCTSAESYYYYKQQEGPSTIDTYQNGKINTFYSNNTFVYTNYFKMLVDQKIDYLLAKNPTYDELPAEFDIYQLFDSASLQASLDGVVWVHTFVLNNRLQWDLINANQIIPIYADNLKRILKNIIRYYKIDEDDITQVEVWDSQKVIFFRVDKYYNFITDSYSEKAHFANITKYENEDKVETVEYDAFGYIPFIPLYNNKCKINDLDSIKQLIDYYNAISSGFIDNIFKFQEFLLTLEGVGGQDLDILMEELQKHKTLLLPEASKASYLSVEIPVEARSIILEILKKNIFLLGRGVDLQTLQGAGSNITNTLIKAMYADLDMKANDTEKQYKIFYKQLINQINSFYNTDFSNNITFNKCMLYNELEKIEACEKSLGIISLMTTLENHPWVFNAEDEMKRILAEKLSEIQTESETQTESEIDGNN